MFAFCFQAGIHPSAHTLSIERPMNTSRCTYDRRLCVLFRSMVVSKIVRVFVCGYGFGCRMCCGVVGFVVGVDVGVGVGVCVGVGMDVEGWV